MFVGDNIFIDVTNQNIFSLFAEKTVKITWVMKASAS
jgi:hypothetical protein